MTAQILIVDDEESIRFSLKRALERDGHDVAAATDGRQALHLMQHQVFDLILTDLKMDDVNGVELMRQVQAISPDTAIIMLTGYATLESAIEALRQGAVDYLVKPCSSADVRADKLHCVLVARNYKGIYPLRRGLLRQCGQDVIGLVALQFIDGYPVCLKQAFYNRELAYEVVRHGLPRYLVLLVNLVPEGGAFQVKANRHHVRRFFLDNLPDHRRYAVNGVRGLALRIR